MKILIAGANGQLGQAMLRVCSDLQLPHCGVAHAQMDITDLKQIAAVVEREQPTYVVNMAAVSDVRAAQSDAAHCYAVNRDGAANLARVCAEHSIPLLHLSTDYVFDGQLGLPYTEEHKPNPQNVYGNSKLEGEEAVRELCPQHVIVRSSWVFAATGNNFFARTLAALQRGDSVQAANDQIGCPTYAVHLAQVCAAILQQVDCDTDPPLWGTYHYCDRGPTTRYDFARTIATTFAQRTEAPEPKVEPIDSSALNDRVYSARHAVLATEKLFFTFGIRQRGWRQGVKRAVEVAAQHGLTE